MFEPLGSFTAGTLLPVLKPFLCTSCTMAAILNFLWAFTVEKKSLIWNNYTISLKFLPLCVLLSALTLAVLNIIALPYAHANTFPPISFSKEKWEIKHVFSFFKKTFKTICTLAVFTPQCARKNIHGKKDKLTSLFLETSIGQVPERNDRVHRQPAPLILFPEWNGRNGTQDLKPFQYKFFCDWAATQITASKFQISRHLGRLSSGDDNFQPNICQVHHYLLPLEVCDDSHSLAGPG